MGSINDIEDQEKPKFVMVVGSGVEESIVKAYREFSHPRAIIIGGDLHIGSHVPGGTLHVGTDSYDKLSQAFSNLDKIKLTSCSTYEIKDKTSVIPTNRKSGSRKGKGKSK